MVSYRCIASIVECVMPWKIIGPENLIIVGYLKTLQNRPSKVVYEMTSDEKIVDMPVFVFAESAFTTPDINGTFLYLIMQNNPITVLCK